MSVSTAKARLARGAETAGRSPEELREIVSHWGAELELAPAEVIIEWAAATFGERFCVTSIVITHDMATAYGIADRVILLANGKVAAEGDPEAVFRLEDAPIRPFALSSGVDPGRLAHRHVRSTPATIRQRWEAACRMRPQEQPSWLGRLVHGV